MATVPLLEVQGLKTHFFLRRGVVKAVDDVSFTIGERETLGLVGESGSGKSITALSLMRLIPTPGRIVDGSVKFEGTELMNLPEREMRRYRGGKIAMILQDPLSSLNPVLTIGDQLGEAVRLHDNRDSGYVRERSVSLLRQVGISAPDTRFGQYPHQLSGGMRQRVVGAIALACKPRLLIADEPTTSLDVTVQEQVLSLLRDLKQQAQLSMIMVTHDFGVVAKMCDSVAVMYAGKIVEKAAVREIFDKPAHPYTKALMASVPKANVKIDRLQSIPSQPPALRNLPRGCPFQPRCSERFAKCSEMPPEVTLPGGRTVRCWHHA